MVHQAVTRARLLPPDMARTGRGLLGVGLLWTLQ